MDCPGRNRRKRARDAASSSPSNDELLLREAKAQVMSLESKLELVQAECRAKSNAVDQLTEQVREWEKEASRQKALFQQLRDQLAKLERDIKLARDTHDLSLVEAARVKTQLIQEHEQRNQEFCDKLKDMRQITEQKEAEIKQLTRDMAAMKHEHKQLDATISMLNARLRASTNAPSLPASSSSSSSSSLSLPPSQPSLLSPVASGSQSSTTSSLPHTTDAVVFSSADNDMNNRAAPISYDGSSRLMMDLESKIKIKERESKRLRSEITKLQVDCRRADVEKTIQIAAFGHLKAEHDRLIAEHTELISRLADPGDSSIESS